MKTNLKNRLKIAAFAAILLVGMVAYKVVYDKRKDAKKEEEED